MTEVQPKHPFDALVLAAGSGSRFGGGKLLAAYGGGCVLDGALAAAFAAPARSVIVVTGADAEMVGQAARAFAARIGQAARLRIVDCPGHAEGMSASLRAGVDALPQDAEATFVFLGDMPRVPVKVLAPLAQAVADGAIAAAPMLDGKRGHPSVLHRDLFGDIARLRGDMGARKVLKDLGDELVLISTDDDGVLFDVDAPDDLSR